MTSVRSLGLHGGYALAVKRNIGHVGTLSLCRMLGVQVGRWPIAQPASVSFRPAVATDRLRIGGQRTAVAPRRRMGEEE
eukprot:5817309-Pyramimonas_sp.AAC.1